MFHISYVMFHHINKLNTITNNLLFGNQVLLLGMYVLTLSTENRNQQRKQKKSNTVPLSRLCYQGISTRLGWRCGDYNCVKSRHRSVHAKIRLWPFTGSVSVCVLAHGLIQDTCCSNGASLILILHQSIATLSPRYQLPLSLYPVQSNLSRQCRGCGGEGHAVLIRARLPKATLFIFIRYFTSDVFFARF